jgi:hypothetical protein
MLLGTFASQMGARIAVEQAYLGSLNARQLAERDWLYASRYAVALFSRQFAISQFPFTAENFPTYLQGHRFDAETVRLLGIAFDGNCHGNRRPDQSLIGAFISLTGRCTLHRRRPAGSMRL